jgi:transposase
MKIEDLFTVALGLSDPWFIEEIEFKKREGKGKELHLHMGHKKGAKFKYCGDDCSVYDHQNRTWRHLNFFEHECYLHCEVPRISTPDGVKLVETPWSRPGSSFTLLFSAFALLLIKGGMSMSRAGKALGIDGRSIQTILSNEVEKALGEQDLDQIDHLAVDETSTRKGHHYLTILTDAKRQKVVGIAQGKGLLAMQHSLESMEKRGASRRHVGIVTMDMSQAYIKGAKQYMPQAEVVFDRFHIEQLMNKALDQIRRKEAKQYSELKKTRYLWLKNNYNLSDDQRSNVEMLSHAYPTLGKAYRLKEQLKVALNDANIISTTVDLQQWMHLAANSAIKPIERVVETLNRNWKGVAAYFTHLATNAIAERVNLKIQEIKRIAKGYRNIPNFINMIYFHIGKLQLPTMIC